MHNTTYVKWHTGDLASLPSWKQAGLTKGEKNMSSTQMQIFFPVSCFFYETLHKTMLQINTILEHVNHHTYKAPSASIWTVLISLVP